MIENESTNNYLITFLTRYTEREFNMFTAFLNAQYVAGGITNYQWKGTSTRPEFSMDPSTTYVWCLEGTNLRKLKDIHDHMLGENLLIVGDDSASKQQNEKNEQMVDSTSNERTINNVMRHNYRVLDDSEKETMQTLKDVGLEFHEYIDSLGDSRELSIAKTKLEEAVMWAVKHVTR